LALAQNPKRIDLIGRMIAVVRTGRRRTGLMQRRVALGLLAAAGFAAGAPAAGAATPDIGGVWRMARPAEIKDARERDPPIPPAPLNAAYAARYQAQEKAYRDADAEGRPIARDREVCIPDGFPKMLTTDLPLEILQSPGRITLITEFLSQVRRISLDRRSHPRGDDLDDTFFGDSIGRWEGRTLVVDTVGLKPRTQLFNDVPHSDQLHVVERIALAAPDILRDEITMTDPVAFTAPWTVTRVFVRRPDLHVGEFVCEEASHYYRGADGRLALKPG
jgi:hypothetical protein